MLKANLGQARTWICQHASTPWFVMTDSDAMASRDWLEQLLQFRNSSKDDQLGAVSCSPVEMQETTDAKLKKALKASSLQSNEYYSKTIKNPDRFGISLCLVKTEAARNFHTENPVLEDILFGWHLNHQGWNHYSLSVPYYHKPLLSMENTLRRARIMGAWMRKIQYTTLYALMFNSIRVPISSPFGSKIQNFKVYLNLIVGWFTHNRYTTDYKWTGSF